MADFVAIEGLTETQHALRAISRDAPKLITRAGKPAARVVQKEAQRRAPVFDGPPRTPWRIIDSIRVRSNQRGAGIAIGGPKAPHAPVHEFGGTIRRAGGLGGSARGRRRQLGAFDRAFRSERANAGRTPIRAQPYLYPAIAAKRGEVERIYVDALDGTLAREFPQLRV